MSQDTLTFTANNINYSLNLTFAGTSTSGTVTAIKGTVNGVTQTMTLVSYANSDQTLLATTPILDSGGISFAINGVDYNIAYVTNTNVNNATYTGYVFETKSGNTQTAYTISAPVLKTNVCFVTGTHILTERGEVPVESLAVGDLVVTSSGARRPIQWLGHRRVDCRRHPNPEDALPVRIAAHAFGPNRPHRDLMVSPGHAVCVDVLGEILVPAYCLINGTTIQQVDVESVVYWHVELDSHDILMAENLAAESYLDMGNRHFFVESGVVLIDPAPDARNLDRERDLCRPMHREGPMIVALRQRLAARAQELGWTLTNDPFNDLHLLVDGERVAPETDGLRARFALPAGAREVDIVVRAAAPWDLPDARPDLRPLGACLAALTLDDGAGPRAIALDDPRLGEGFHAPESYDWGAFRWTGPRASLGALIAQELAQGGVLELRLLRPCLPIWRAPAPAAAEILAA